MALPKYEKVKQPRQRAVRSDAKYRNFFVVERSNGKIKWLFSYRAKTIVQASDWIRLNKVGGWYYRIVKERFSVDTFDKLRRTVIKHILLPRIKRPKRKVKKKKVKARPRWNPHRWDVMYRPLGGEWCILSTFKVKENALKKVESLREIWEGVDVTTRYKRVDRRGNAYKIQSVW